MPKYLYEMSAVIGFTVKARTRRAADKKAQRIAEAVATDAFTVKPKNQSILSVAMLDDISNVFVTDADGGAEYVETQEE